MFGAGLDPALVEAVKPISVTVFLWRPVAQRRKLEGDDPVAV